MLVNITYAILLCTIDVQVYFMDAQIWYAIFSTLFGGIRGTFSHLGEVSCHTMGKIDSDKTSIKYCVSVNIPISVWLPFWVCRMFDISFMIVSSNNVPIGFNNSFPHDWLMSFSLDKNTWDVAGQISSCA